MIFPIIFLALFPVLFVAFWLFDRLVRLEYERYPTDWHEDGKPHGFFWVPAEAKALGGLTTKWGSSMARSACALSWLCGTPDWMRNEPRAQKLVVWYRVFVISWNVGLVGAIVLNAML